MTAVDLDALDAARAAIGDSPVFSVTGFVQDEDCAEQVLACFDDGGTSVFAECYGSDAAALIVAAVNNLPALIAAARERDALLDAVKGLAEQWEGWRDNARRYERHALAEGSQDLADQAHVRALAYERAIEDARAVLAAVDGGKGA